MMNDTISRLMEAPDVRWTDDEGVSVGHDALDERSQKLQQQSQGLGGDPVASGFDAAIVRNDVIAEPYTVIT